MKTVTLDLMLMKVLSHPGHGKSKCCIVGNWTCFSLLKTFHLSSKRLFQFWLTGGLQAFKLCVGSAYRFARATCRTLAQPTFMWIASARWAQMWMVVMLSGERTQSCIVLGHLLCSKKVIPVWHTWIILLLFQTICLLWPRCLHCCPQRNYLSPSDVSGPQSLDLKSWPSCVVPSVYGEVVLSPQCTNLCSPGCIEQHKLHYSVYAWVFCP